MSNSCPNCGVSIKSDDAFCPFCGTTTSQPSSDSSFPDSQYADQFASSSPSADESYSYGSGSGGYYTESADSTKKWYKPPKRTRSAKHPVEWFFWIGWGLYILLRIVFYVLIIAAQIAVRRK